MKFDLPFKIYLLTDQLFLYWIEIINEQVGGLFKCLLVSFKFINEKNQKTWEAEIEAVIW